MATVRWVGLLALAACGDLQGFGGPVPPLVTFDVTATGDLASVRPAGDTGTPDLHVAIVWGRQWLVEALCILPPENADAAAVIAAGCRDPFGFVPARVAADVPATVGTPATIDLFTVPGADVMVGDLSARVAYATAILYDDKNGDGVLNLGRPDRPGQMGPPMTGDLPTQITDLVYAASFITMTQPDQRVAFREGAFIQSGFYPRAGCGDPPAGFSLLAAGGFSAADAIAATLAGTLPQEPAASCAEQDPATPFTIPVAPPATLQELRCSERITDSSVRYREPTSDPPPDLDQRKTACVHSPSFGPPSDTIELVITGRATDSCVGLTHYILKGCREGPQCGTPDWDHSLAPPSWWPC